MSIEIDSNTEELVIAALKKAVLQGGPLRLYQPSKGEGLFPASREDFGDLETFCLTGEKPLFVKIETEKSASKGVVVGPGAFDYLAAKVDPAELSDLLSEGLKKVTKRYQDARRYWADIVAQNHATLEALEEIRDRALKLQATRTQTLVSKMLEEPLEVESEEDFDNARRFGIHLVNALRFGGTIETVLHNSGFERIGQAGDRVPFNSRLHTSESSIVPSAMVVIETSGWLLRMDNPIAADPR